jgi:hypothetical protein
MLARMPRRRITTRIAANVRLSKTPRRMEAMPENARARDLDPRTDLATTGTVLTTTTTMARAIIAATPRTVLTVTMIDPTDTQTIVITK